MSINMNCMLYNATVVCLYVCVYVCVSVLQACAVMALERVPADIRKDGGIARMSDPKVGSLCCASTATTGRERMMVGQICMTTNANCSSFTQMIKEILKAVTIPVMAKVRIGHFAEAQILEALGVDYIDESEGVTHYRKLISGHLWQHDLKVAFSPCSVCAVRCSVLTAADEENHVEKHQFKVPFVAGARNLGEALRRIAEGAAMIRVKGEAGTGVLTPHAH